MKLTDGTWFGSCVDISSQISVNIQKSHRSVHVVITPEECEALSAKLLSLAEQGRKVTEHNRAILASAYNFGVEAKKRRINRYVFDDKEFSAFHKRGALDNPFVDEWERGWDETPTPPPPPAKYRDQPVSWQLDAWDGTTDPEVLSRFTAYSVPSKSAAKNNACLSSRGKIWLLVQNDDSKLRYTFVSSQGANSDNSFSGSLLKECNNLSLEDAGEIALDKVAAWCRCRPL